jgi:hypothetical protein
MQSAWKDLSRMQTLPSVKKVEATDVRKHRMTPVLSFLFYVFLADRVSRKAARAVSTQLAAEVTATLLPARPRRRAATQISLRLGAV